MYSIKYMDVKFFLTIVELFENRLGFETPTILSLYLVGRSRLLFSLSSPMPKIHYTRFSVTMKLPTCYGLVSDTANKSATSRCNGIWERHDTTDTTDFCPSELVTDLLRGNWCNGFWPLVS